MPEVETYKFSHKELLKILIKASGIHEGKWLLTVNFSFAAASIGQSDEDVLPTAIAGVSHVAITRAKNDSPKALVVDAAEVNPSSTASRPPSSRSRRAAPKKAS